MSAENQAPGSHELTPAELEAFRNATAETSGYDVPKLRNPSRADRAKSFARKAVLGVVLMSGAGFALHENGVIELPKMPTLSTDSENPDVAPVSSGTAPDAAPVGSGTDPSKKTPKASSKVKAPQTSEFFMNGELKFLELSQADTQTLAKLIADTCEGKAKKADFTAAANKLIEGKSYTVDDAFKGHIEDVTATLRDKYVLQSITVNTWFNTLKHKH